MDSVIRTNDVIFYMDFMTGISMGFDEYGYVVLKMRGKTKVKA